MHRIHTVQDERDKVEEYVHRWGGSTSEVALDLPCKYFSIPEIEGVISYRLIGGCAISIGDPICAPENTSQLALAFYDFCQQNQFNATYIITSEQFSKWAIKNVSKALVEIGSELIFDPQIDPTEGPSANRLRNKTNHAKNSGLTVEEYLSDDPKIEQAIKRVGEKWLQGRRGPQIHLSPLDFFENRTDKRWFYAKKGNEIIGAALLSRIESKQGWLLKFQIAVPTAPRGTTALLMLSILETLRKEDCSFLTYGMIPANHLGEIIGLGTLSTWMAKIAFKIAKWIFKLDQRKSYWEQFKPQHKKIYALFSHPHVSLQEIRAILKSLIIES